MTEPNPSIQKSRTGPLLGLAQLPLTSAFVCFALLRARLPRHGSILAFIGYLIFLDPDLYAIEFAGGKLAKRVWKRYKPGQKQAKRVSVVQFDSRSGNWTNPWDAYEDRYYIKGRGSCGEPGWFSPRL